MATEKRKPADADPVAALTSRLESIVSRDDGRSLAGLAVLAVKDGEIAYKKAFGYRYIDNEDSRNNLPFETGTKMRIASISKTVSAIGAVQLAEQGKIDLDEDVSRYLGFSLRNPNFPETAITARMLLSHTSSLRDGGAYVISPWHSLQELLNEDGAYYENGSHFAGTGQKAGEYFSYASINFGVLATIMEAVSGERFDIYMHEHVLKPMGIAGSYAVSDFNRDEMKNLAVIYGKDYGADGNSRPGSPWIPTAEDYRGATVEAESNCKIGTNATYLGPQGGLRTSVDDLAKLAQMFINDGAAGKRQILTKESIDQMVAPQWTWNGKDGEGTNGEFRGGRFVCYGLGVQINKNGERRGGYRDAFLRGRKLNVVGHYGDAYGMFSQFMVDRESGSAFIYMSNGAECDLHAGPAFGKYSANWIWDEEIVTALYTFLFPPISFSYPG